MVRRLRTEDPGFEASLADLLSLKREADADVGRAVREIIERVRQEGDAAVRALTRQFDRHDTDDLRFSAAEIAEHADRADPAAVAALEVAAARIEAFHRRQVPEDARFTDASGVTLGWRWTAVDSVGLYVPGGLATYPSSVLMNAVPARVAGVERLVMTVPTPDGVVNPLVMAAARIAGIDEIHRIGGAQAIAALAYGTASLSPVDKIVGPGNAYVAAAKREVYGQVGIDSIAGPSEILVVADGDNDPEWIAADLLSQAEHDPSSQSVLLTDDASFADAVADAAARLIAESPRRDVTHAAWADNSAIIVLSAMEEAPGLVDRFAPEHLELAVADPEALFARVRHAGAVFLGRHTPEAIGDYVAGPDHVLPTARSARFSSGLSVLDFVKRTTVTSCSPDALSAIGPAAVTLAEAEGLWAHGQSVRKRLTSMS